MLIPDMDVSAPGAVVNAAAFVEHSSPASGSGHGEPVMDSALASSPSEKAVHRLELLRAVRVRIGTLLQICCLAHMHPWTPLDGIQYLVQAFFLRAR
jgi:hypothetical protein